MKKTIQDNAKKWPLVIALIFALEVINRGSLSIVAPEWACDSISILLICLVAAYISVIFQYFWDKYKSYMGNRKEEMLVKFTEMQDHLDELSEKNIALQQQLKTELENHISDSRSRVVEEVSSKIKDTEICLMNKIQEFEESIVAKMDSSTNRVNDEISKTEKSILTEAKNLDNRILEQNDLIGQRTDFVIDAVDKQSEDLKENFEQMTTKVDNFNEEQKKVINENQEILVKSLQYSEKLGIEQFEAITGDISQFKDAFDTESRLTHEASSSMHNEIVKAIEQQSDVNIEEFSKLTNVLGTYNTEQDERIHNTEESIFDNIQKLSANISEQFGQIISVADKLDETVHAEADAIKGMAESAVQEISLQLKEQTENNRKDFDQLTLNTEKYIAEQNAVIQNTGVSLSEKIESVMESNADHFGSISDVIKVLNDDIKVDLENTINENSTNLDKAVDTIIQNNEGILVEKMQESISFNSEQFDQVSVSIRALSDEMHTNVERADALASETNSCIEKATIDIQKLLQSESTVCQNAVHAASEELRQMQVKENIQLKDSIIGEFQKIDGEINTAVMKAEELQDALKQNIIQILDVQDDEAEKAKKRYDGLLGVVSGLSNSTKQQIETIKEYLNQQHEMLERAEASVERTTLQQTEQNKSVISNVDSYAILSKQYHNDMIMRLGVLQGQITELGALKNMIRDLATAKPAVKEKPDPNRSETITDQNTGLTVLNHFRNNKLKVSEMKKSGKTVHKFEYDDAGKLMKSMSYDERGDLIAELTYYPNEQVKERKEKVKVNGVLKTVTSKFDQKGNKIL